VQIVGSTTTSRAAQTGEEWGDQGAHSAAEEHTAQQTSRHTRHAALWSAHASLRSALAPAELRVLRRLAANTLASRHDTGFWG